METTGIIKVIGETQRVSDKFQKREFVLTTEATTPYPQHVSFQLTQDKCELIQNYNIGDEIKIQFNLRGREWNSPQGIKYFNTLECWRLESVHKNNEGHDSTTTFKYNNNPNDDLPF
jgi:hypothetical protein